MYMEIMKFSQFCSKYHALGGGEGEWACVIYKLKVPLYDLLFNESILYLKQL
jgi:hypothetical protein